MTDNNFIKTNLLPLIFTLITLVLVVIQYTGSQHTGDSAVKHMQMEDMIHLKFNSLACVYGGREVDKEFKHLPLAHDTFMVYIKDGECYHYFPFYFAGIQAPMNMLFGEPGEYIWMVLGIIGVLWLFWHWSFKIGMRESYRKFFMLFLFLGTNITHAVVTTSEGAITVFLTSMAFYCVWRGVEQKQITSISFAAFLLAVATLFRQELAIVAASIPLGMIIIRRKEGFIAGTIFSLVFLGFTAIHFYVNYSLIGLFLGGRQIQQAEEFGGKGIVDNLKMVFEIFVYGRNAVGLFLAFPLTLLIPIFIKDAKKWPESLKIIGVACLIFTFIIPFATITYQGVNWGPRFLFSITPFIILSLFLLLQYREDRLGAPMGKGMRRLIWAGIIYSALGTAGGHGLIYTTNYIVRESNKAVEDFATDVVIYRSPFLYNAGITTHLSKAHLAIFDEKDFKPLVLNLKQAGKKDFTVVYASEYITKDKSMLPENVRELVEAGEKSPFKHFRLQNFKIRD